jgi:hypothetical protein
MMVVLGGIDCPAEHIASDARIRRNDDRALHWDVGAAFWLRTPRPERAVRIIPGVP